MKHLEALDGAQERLKLFQIDLLEPASLVAAIHGAAGVFHLSSSCIVDLVHDPKGINIFKSHGKSARDSFFFNGYALNTSRAAQGMPTRVALAKIAGLDFNLQKTKMQMGVLGASF
ncbi:hypothetical protein J5N97_029989 [Dioscorea zingiberensis]|uniref:Uncharacterized protein n=1 Tax=Dioscorea zingiberensis TaxID=325984 RepID=A0A9D5H3U3_9LILI|nr:hypothetical protein J5N97_029989 [Dioscorea zingiberensis]